MLLPSGAIPWIKLHRTHLKSPETYWTDVQKDFDQIKPFLPGKVETILDIGSGLGGIDVLLAKYYPYAKITLLDGDGSEENFRGGFKDEMKPFNSREIANQMFTLNGLKEPEWKDVGTKELLKYDLIISLLSWGFHYPLETYKTEGTRITDIRAGKPIMGEVIASTVKYNRCKW